MPWTSHGHWYGLSAPTAPQPRLVARCGGPHLCTTCALEAQQGDADTIRRPPMPLSVGASPDDVERLIGMLAVLSRFGKRLSRICDECVDALEEYALPAGTAEDTAAQQRADDDGMPPTG